MKYSLSLSGKQHQKLKKHLFPGDGLESVALIFCHLAKCEFQTKFIAFDIALIADEECKKTATHITWNTKKYLSSDQIERLDKDKLSLITIHSHTGEVDDFSDIDNENDKTFFLSANNWFDDNRPNGSAVMLSSGYIFGRTVTSTGTFKPFSHVSVAGSNIKIFRHKEEQVIIPEFAERISQTFGKGTFSILKKLKIGVIGCSGTGSIITELLARNGVGEIVIVDPDILEKKNLNRIINASLQDAEREMPKVAVLKRALEKMELGTKISAYQSSTSDKQVISALKACDVLFGCVDSALGRYHLDCLSSAYLIPYFDVGVRIYADGQGGISEALAATHYIEPDTSNLFSQEVYTSEQVTAESLKTRNPDRYEEQREEGYITGVDEDQPAVMSVNMQASCMAMNDFLARIHGYRLDDNNDFKIQRMSLTHGYYTHQSGNDSLHPLFAKNTGKADQSNLLKSIL